MLQNKYKYFLIYFLNVDRQWLSERYNCKIFTSIKYIPSYSIRTG